jgi:AMMECR1 domain-containing protein
VRRATDLVLPVLALLLTAPARAETPLEPYRALARSAAAPRLLAVARAALERHWSGAADDTLTAPDWPGAPTALYLSLVRGRATRACVGTPAPPRGTLAASVRALAEAAVASDPRRPPLRRDELAGLRLVLAFAGQPVPLADPMSVDPGREGLLIAGARGHVAFLPGEARTVAWALREASRVGVLDAAPAGAEYFRFPVVVLTESSVRTPPGEAADEDP